MNQLSGKKILVLAGQDVHCKVVETAKEMGVYTIVADYLEDSPAKKIADDTAMLSIVDVDAIVEYCKKNNIDGVVNFCNDLAPRFLQQINEKLGLPNIGTKEQVSYFTNKEKFKQLCIKNSVDVIPEYTESDIVTNTIEYPVFVKPVDSRGSRGSNICYNEKELINAIRIAKTFSASGDVIIEKYISGLQEVEITYIVIDGEPYLINFADRYCGNRKDKTDKISTCFIQPSWFIDTYLKNVDKRVQNMLKDAGLKNCAIFLQGFIDGETIRMFDPAIRFPGNEYERIFAKATGVNPMNSVISYSITGKMNDFNGQYKESYDLNGKASVQIMVNSAPGIINAFQGLDMVKAHPAFIYLGEKCEEGETIEDTSDTNRRVFDISFLVDRNKDAIYEIINLVNDNVKILDVDGNDMVVSKFDFSKVENKYQY